MTEIFTPGKIGRLELKNRIVRSATWEALGDKDGRVTDKLIAYIRRLAEGGVGLIVLGITAVAPEGKGMFGMVGMYSDDHIEGHAKLTEAVHDAGGRISIQLAHVGGQASPKYMEGREPVGPSAVLNPAFNVTPRELSAEEVREVVAAFGRAAAMASEAGYDAVQIHGAHGYLVDQFMSPHFNKRADEYGEPRRFIMEVYDAVRSNAGKAAVHVKLSADDFLEGSTAPDISLPIARELAESGIDAIEVSAGTPSSGKMNPSRTKIDETSDEGYLFDLARLVAKEVSCPVIGVGGWRSVERIEQALSSGVDFVSMSRPLIREPELVKRWKDGDTSRATCISCNKCFGTVKYGEGVQCMVDLRERRKGQKD